MSASALEKALLSAIGGNTEEQGVTEFINTGFPPLNKIISGSYDKGLPQGRLVEIYGESSSGKTALATNIMIHAQRMGGVVGFMDHERSFAIEMAVNMGLSDTFPFWIYKQPKTWEESNTTMVKAAKAIRESKVIAENAPILFVLDSIASALPRSTVEKEFDEYNMNDTTALARVTSTTLKAMAALANEYNFTVLYLNQVRTVPGIVYGPNVTTPGGKAMEFFATVRVALSRKKVMDTDKEFIGQEITMKTSKNKLTKPFQETTLRMGFNDDGSAFFDTTTSMIDHLVSLGKIESSGARVSFEGKSYYKKQLVEHINTNGLQEELVKLLKD